MLLAQASAAAKDALSDVNDLADVAHVAALAGMRPGRPVNSGRQATPWPRRAPLVEATWPVVAVQPGNPLDF